MQHGMHVMMSAKGIMRANEATRGMVRLRIPSIHKSTLILTQSISERIQPYNDTMQKVSSLKPRHTHQLFNHIHRQNSCEFECEFMLTFL